MITQYIESEQYTEFVHSVKGIRIFFNDTYFCVIFIGRKRKPFCTKKFDSEWEMILFLDSSINEQYQINESKQKEQSFRKEQAIENRKKVVVGDIFFTSWGYDQTNVEFFQVVDKPSPAKVLVRQIARKQRDIGNMSANVTPVKDSFVSENKNCLINRFGNINNIDDYGHCGRKTMVTEEHYCSWYG